MPSSTDDKDDVKDQHGVPIEPQKEEAALRGSAAALEFDIKTTSNIKAALGKSVEKVRVPLYFNACAPTRLHRSPFWHTLPHPGAQVQLDLEARTMSYGVPGVPSKIVHCHKISQMTRGGRSADNLRQVNFVITQDDWRTEKEWLFGSTADSTRFVRFIQAVNACGQQIRDAFNELDVRGTGHIGAEDLQHFSRDLPRETLERMIASASHANLSTGVNFRDFFELFMESPIFYIYSVDQAINVWHLLVREGDSITEAPGTPESRKMTWTALKRAVSAPTLRSQAQTKPSLVPGERLMNMVEKVRYYIINEQKYHKTQQPSTSGTHPIQGALFLTSFRLVLRSYRSHYGSGSDECGRPRQPNEMPDAFTQIDLPVAAISRIELARETNRAVIIWCKDLRVLHITFSGNDLFVANLVDFVCDLAFPDGGSTSTFELARHLNGAFASKFTTPTSMSEAKGQAFGLSPHASVGERNGWALYNLRSEFERQGVLPSARWRLYGDNYQLVDTYPLEFVLPAAFTESEIQVAAKFRTRKRLPALTWRDSSSGACLVRSSQPYVGVGAHRCPEDEKLLNILRCHGDPSSATEQKMPSDFYIVDARGRAAAIGNKARGKGVENVNNYACTKLHFCDIGNIHTMRASLKELASIVLPSGDGADSENWLSNLENTKWLSHIRSLLKGAVFIAEKLRMEGASVLVHCSDGWDRTAQLSATAQILLDPYFRSIKGFAVLVEKVKLAQIVTLVCFGRT